MLQVFSKYLRQIFLVFIAVIMAGGTGFAQEEKSANPQQRMSEIIGTLSGLAGKKPVIKKKQDTVPTVKTAELKAAIQILQNPKNREQIISVLSALAYAQEETEKKQLFNSRFTDLTAAIINTTSEFILDSASFVTQIPDSIAKGIEKLFDAKQRQKILMIAITVILSFVVGTAGEALMRLVMLKSGFTRPKTYAFQNFAQHVFRNSLPIILFGVSAYGLLFYYPGLSGDALDTSFMWVTAIVMLRILFIVLRILFSLRDIRATEKTRYSYFSSYQFALALAQILISGIIFAELGVILGAGERIHQIWFKILGFGVTSLLLLAIWKFRFWVIAKFQFEGENCSNLALIGIRLVQFLGRYWHWFISFALLLSGFLYFIGMIKHSLFVAGATVLTIILTMTTLWLRNSLQRVHNWMEDKVTDKDARLFLSLSTQPRAALLNFLQFLLHFVYIVLLLQIWGVDPLGMINDKTIHPYLASALSIVLIIVVIRLLWIWVNHIAMKHVQVKVVKGRKVHPSLFAKTVTPILQSVSHWVLVITAVILILEEVGIPIMPIIYGISVIGIAISLGAQSLVKDLINGVLTLMEGNIAVGEVVVIGSHAGTVESLSLRGVSLRHGSGALQSIPFSEVSNIINKSRDYTSVPIELSFPYKTEMSKVEEVLQAAYNDTIADSSLQRMVIEPLAVSGVDRFTEAGFVVTGSIRIKPDPGNRFARAFNQNLKTYLETEKITPPVVPNTLLINNSTAEVKQG